MSYYTEQQEALEIPLYNIIHKRLQWFRAFKVLHVKLVHSVTQHLKG